MHDCQRWLAHAVDVSYYSMPIALRRQLAVVGLVPKSAVQRRWLVVVGASSEHIALRTRLAAVALRPTPVVLRLQRVVVGLVSKLVVQRRWLVVFVVVDASLERIALRPQLAAPALRPTPVVPQLQLAFAAQWHQLLVEAAPVVSASNES